MIDHLFSLFSNRARWPGLLLMLMTVLPLTACGRAPQTPSAPVAAQPSASRTATDAPAPAATLTPTPTLPPTSTSTTTALPTLTPTPTPGPTVSPDIAAVPAVVRQGDFLSTIAARYRVSLDALISYNAIENPNAVAVGQRLMIPYQTNRFTPDQTLLPDSELVYGPAYLDFDVAAFVAQQDGWLAHYAKPWFDGQTLSGAQLVDYVAMRYSVGPRVLLAMLEARSGWVTNPEEPQAQERDFPMGHLANGGGLEVQLEWAAAALNSGFYGWMERGETGVRFRDYSIARGAPGLNPGTIAIQRTLAQDTTFSGLPAELDAFMDAYHRLFGDPFQYDQGRILPRGLQQPSLAFPWEPGEWWYLTGGPHGAWGAGSSWAALDFVPQDAPIGACAPAQTWARAAASGLVVRNNRGELLEDLDGDGDMRTGWVLQYLHIADRPPAGTHLQIGDPIGRPSCEGGRAASSHLHIARRYNGVWVAAGGPIPLQLDGWTAFAGNSAYAGGMIGPQGQKITACDCREENINGILIGK